MLGSSNGAHPKETCLLCRASPGTVPGMSSTAEPRLVESGYEDPVVAEVGGVRLVWHARALRGERSLTEAAKLVRLNRDELSRIEKGETTQIRFETVVKLIAGYQCQLTDLLHVEVEPTDTPKPLYEGALEALRAGALLPTSRRRTVRRASSLDVVDEGDARRFASAPEVQSPRRRAAQSTLNKS
jgi:DNA-binding Xre family transcriptional regulator